LTSPPRYFSSLFLLGRHRNFRERGGGRGDLRLLLFRLFGFAIATNLTFCHRYPPLTEARGCEPGVTRDGRVFRFCKQPLEDLQPAESGQILVEDTIDLDGRRGMAAQKATRMRRQHGADEAGHAALRARREELDHLLVAAPATGWVEAVAKARYLLILLAQTPAAEDLWRARLIADDRAN
jgi:hypothetical protein